MQCSISSSVHEAAVEEQIVGISAGMLELEWWLVNIAAAAVPYATVVTRYLTRKRDAVVIEPSAMSIARRRARKLPFSRARTTTPADATKM